MFLKENVTCEAAVLSYWIVPILRIRVYTEPEGQPHGGGWDLIDGWTIMASQHTEVPMQTAVPVRLILRAGPLIAVGDQQNSITKREGKEKNPQYPSGCLQVAEYSFSFNLKPILKIP